MGVIVIYKPNMHEKLIFIDDEIIWIGSLNTLSFNDTQEIMRRVSQSVLNHDVQTLKLNELINEYEEWALCPKRPICGSQVVASEVGKNHIIGVAFKIIVTKEALISLLYKGGK